MYFQKFQNRNVFLIENAIILSIFKVWHVLIQLCLLPSFLLWLFSRKFSHSLAENKQTWHQICHTFVATTLSLLLVPALSLARSLSLNYELSLFKTPIIDSEYLPIHFTYFFLLPEKKNFVECSQHFERNIEKKRRKKNERECVKYLHCINIIFDDLMMYENHTTDVHFIWILWIVK